MARASWGAEPTAESSAYYFEVTKVNDLGNIRVGWSTAQGNVEGNVGFDQWSFGYRDVDGSYVHKSKRIPSGGAPFGKGDVIGCYLWFPSGGAPGQIFFFKNGVSSGAAFNNIPLALYYPAVSMFGGATVQVNFGPDMKVEPLGPLPHPWVPASALEGRFGLKGKQQQQRATTEQSVTTVGPTSPHVPESAGAEPSFPPPVSSAVRPPTPWASDVAPARTFVPPSSASSLSSSSLPSSLSASAAPPVTPSLERNAWASPSYANLIDLLCNDNNSGQ